MKIATTTDELTAVLSVASRVASARSAVAALSGAQIVASADGVEVRATDSEVGVRLPMIATVEEEGSVCVMARMLFDVVRAAKPGAATLEYVADRDVVEIQAGRNTTAIRALRNQDFPEIPPPGDDLLEMPAGELADSVRRVTPAASRDQTRPVLTGVYLRAKGTDLQVVATDSYRLGARKATLSTPVADAIEANIPARAMAELERLIRETGAETVRIGQPRQQVVFIIGSTTLTSRLIAGEYPAFEQIVPTEFAATMQVPREALAEVVHRVSLMAMKNAPVALAFSEGQVEVYAAAQDTGDSRETIEIPYHGDAMTVGFNPEFLRDGLAAFDGDEVTFSIIDPLKPGLLTGEGLRYLLMPLRVPAPVAVPVPS